MNSVRHLGVPLAVLAVTVFTAGFFATISQVVFTREILSIFSGNELYVGGILGFWLFWIAIGSLAHRLLIRQSRKSQASSSSYFPALMLIFFLIAFFIQQELISAGFLCGVLKISAGEPAGLLKSVLFLLISLFPVGVLIGFFFPAITGHLNAQTMSGVGRAYLFESAGSVLAGLIFTFFFAERMELHRIFAIMAMIICAVTLSTLVVDYIAGIAGNSKSRIPNYKKIRKTYAVPIWIIIPVIIFSAMAAYMVFSGAFEKIEKKNTISRWAIFNPGFKLVDYKDTKYQRVTVLERDKQYFVYGNSRVIFGFPELYESSTYAHLALTQHKSPKKILLIGSAGPDVIIEALKHPVEKIDCVEIDRGISELAEKYFNKEEREAFRDKRLKTYDADGRKFVKERGEKYDLILVNAPDPSNAMINRFYTLEFFRELKKILGKGGVVQIGVRSAVNYAGPEVLDYVSSIYFSFRKEFKYVAVIPGEKNYLFGSNFPGNVTEDADTLMERFEKRKINTEHFTKYHYYTIFNQDSVARIKRDIESRAGSVKLNTDASPVAYFFNMVLWERFSEGRVKIFGALKNAGYGWLIAGIILILVVGIYLLQRNAGRGISNPTLTYCISVTGFAGMAIEILVMFMYQSQFGYLYGRIGLIIAGFMAGLVIGSYIATRRIEAKSDLPGLLILSEAGFVVLIPALTALFFTGGMQLFYGALLYLSVIITGFIAGVQFPLVGELYKSEDKSVSAGRVNFGDHIGAFAGAFLCGTLLVPLFGIIKVCVLLLLLKLAGLVFMLIEKQRD